MIMMKLLQSSLTIVFVGIAAALGCADAGRAPAATGQSETRPALGGAQRPPLVVICVFDQMREDYLDIYQPVFGPDGFNRVMREGVRFKNCNYPYAATETGPGHATIGSGRLPRNHGIIANEWWGHRKSKNGRDYIGKIYCIDDMNFKYSAAKADGVDQDEVAPSHSNFRGQNLNDQVRAAIPGSLIYSMSHKDRSAILMGGPSANGAFWFKVDGERPNSPEKNSFISSTYYYNNGVPDWIEPFMKKQIAAIPDQWAPDRSNPIYRDKNICSDDDVKWEGGPGLVHRFPYDLRKKGLVDWDVISVTPQSMVMLTEFAFEWINRAGLGADAATDMLWISYSTTDIAGHSFGPRSHELIALYEAADREIARLLKKMDATVGVGNYIFAITSDHGVALVPEDPASGGARRVVWDSDDDRRLVETQLHAAFGKEYKKDWAARVIGCDWYLNHERILKEGIETAQAAGKLKEIILQQPGVLAAYTRADMDLQLWKKDTIGQKVWNSYDPERSADVTVILKPGWLPFPTGGKYVTTHGTPHIHDTHVPLLIMAPGAPRGTASSDPVTPLDLVPSVANLLKIPAPVGCDGRVLPGMPVR